MFASDFRKRLLKVVLYQWFPTVTCATPFGYYGHNQNPEVVMYNHDNDITTLTNSDKDHIRQLYDYLRMYEE